VVLRALTVRCVCVRVRSDVRESKATIIQYIGEVARTGWLALFVALPSLLLPGVPLHAVAAGARGRRQEQRAAGGRQWTAPGYLEGWLRCFGFLYTAQACYANADRRSNRASASRT
jgi:hypothetical protein